jgi:tetratricopeptide (TPR) repeat protein
VVLAQVERDRGDLSAALATTDTALRELAELGSDAGHPGLFFVRGDLFARLGQAADAEAAFLREIDEFPADARSYTRLAALYASVGAGGRAAAVLERLVERNPRSPAAWAEAVKALRVLGGEADAARLLARAERLFPNEPALAALR